MVEYDTHYKKTIEYGTNQFIELAVRTAHSDRGDYNIIGISKGNIGKNNEPRFMKAIGIPTSDKKVLTEFQKEFQKCIDNIPKETKRGKQSKSSGRESKGVESKDQTQHNKQLQKQIKTNKESIDKMVESQQQILELLTKKKGKKGK